MSFLLIYKRKLAFLLPWYMQIAQFYVFDNQMLNISGKKSWVLYSILNARYRDLLEETMFMTRLVMNDDTL